MLDWAALIRPTVGDATATGIPADVVGGCPAIARPHADAPQGNQAPAEVEPIHSLGSALNPAAVDVLAAALREIEESYRIALAMLHHHFFLPDRPAWGLCADGLAKLLRDGGTTLEGGAVRCCLTCAGRLRPGLAFPGYCARRPDLPGAYGPGHPLHELPADAGAACSAWALPAAAGSPPA